MIYLIALNARGAAGASMIWRSDAADLLVRIGEHPTCELRLHGAGIATCDLWCDGDEWSIRRPDGTVGRVADGQCVVVGQWTVLMLLDRDADAAALRPAAGPDPGFHAVDDDPPRPHFVLDGTPLGVLADDVPRLVGGAPCCAVRLPWTREPVAGIVRRGARRTRCYPVPGSSLSRNGSAVAAAITLHDGDALALADSPALRFVDPDEEVDRLLGLLRDEPCADEPAEPLRPVPARERVRRVAIARLLAPATIEAALALAAAAAVLTQVVVTIVRW